MRQLRQTRSGLTIAFAMAIGMGIAIVPVRTGAELDESNCVLEAPGVSKRYARCATLSVPLDPDSGDRGGDGTQGGDRGQDGGGETFDLFVARIPSRVANPLPDPLLLIAGGPGQSTVDFYMQNRSVFAPVRVDRDLILVDQRGTGRSASGFQCELPADFDFQIAGEGLLEDLTADCLAGLEHDPGFFTTSVAVRDLDAVRRELGVDQWNIYGVSYGTRVAQHYLRRFPEHVRAVVLDGVVPPTLVLGPEMAINAQATLDRLFQRCAGDDACATRFDDLASVFDELMSRIQESPIPVAVRDMATGETEETLVTGEYLMGVTRLFSYSDTTAALLPLIIHEAANGRFDMLLAQAELITKNVERAISFPMHNSVICSEDYPFESAETPAASPEEANSRRPASTILFEAVETPAASSDAYLGTSIIDALTTICGLWPRGIVDPDFKDPLASAHPILVLSGENDPATPAQYGEDVIAEGLSNALHVTGPGKGHGMAPIGCVPDLMQAFIEAAATEGLDAGCVDSLIPMPIFLSAAGPGP